MDFASEPPGGLVICELGTGDVGLLQATYDAVLRPSFTIDELSGIGAVSPAPGRTVTVALDREGTPVGCAVSDLDDGGIGLLSYLAVSPASRGLGVGGRLLAWLAPAWAGRLVLAEVHDPRGHSETDDEHPEARLRFYARAGARVLDVPFVQPALSGGSRVADMLLLVMAGPDVHRLSAKPLRDWVLAYYLDSEGAEPTDPQGRALLERFAVDHIDVLPLTAWSRVRRLAAARPRPVG